MVQKKKIGRSEGRYIEGGKMLKRESNERKKKNIKSVRCENDLKER